MPLPVSGTIHVLHRSPLYLRTRLTGRFDLTLANALIGALDDWRGARTGLTVFHDCSLLEDYDVAARERISTWTRAHRGSVEAIHVLVQNRAIAWALRLMSVVSGTTLITYHSLESFEAVFARRRSA